MPVDVILGLQWGDEGKGKLVDMLASRYQVVARFQGGPNAGHTLYVKGKKYVLHQVPSAAFQSGTRNLIGGGTVIDPIILQQEISKLRDTVTDLLDRLYISKHAHLILPLHRELDEKEERHRGKQKIGSTGRGIGPCYQDKYARRGLRVADLFDLAQAKAKYSSLRKWHAPYLGARSDSRMEIFWAAAERLKSLQIVDDAAFVQELLGEGGHVLAEGAQGSMLDIDRGTYPYVTSSHTSIGGVCTGLGVSPKQIGRIYGVSKAYCTRVGEGPFPSEIRSPLSKELQRRGQEFGSVTGRPRRCGWLDLSALRQTATHNGVEALIITKLDVLAGMSELKLRFADRTPTQLISFKGWPKDTSFSVNSHWPDALRAFLRQIEEELKLPVVGISYGPEREESIMEEAHSSVISRVRKNTPNKHQTATEAERLFQRST